MTSAELGPRQQGAIGELSAMQWLAARGALVFAPIGHSPDVDLIALIDGTPLRIEVKTSTNRTRDRWSVQIATSGGNRSWNGTVKRFDPARCEYLFVHVGDGRRWLIPTFALDCATGLTLGGSKYSEFEIDRADPLTPPRGDPPLDSPAASGEYRSGQTGRAVNALAQSFVGSNPASPITGFDRSGKPPVRPTSRERALGRRGHAIVNQKRRVTIPQRPFFEAGLENGSKVQVRALGPGRLILEQIELPAWARGPAQGEDDAA